MFGITQSEAHLIPLGFLIESKVAQSMGPETEIINFIAVSKPYKFREILKEKNVKKTSNSQKRNSARPEVQE